MSDTKPTLGLIGLGDMGAHGTQPHRKRLWGYAMSQGAAKEDMTTIGKYLERWNGVEVRGKGYDTMFVPQASAQKGDGQRNLP